MGEGGKPLDRLAAQQGALRRPPPHRIQGLAPVPEALRLSGQPALLSDRPEARGVAELGFGRVRHGGAGGGDDGGGERSHLGRGPCSRSVLRSQRPCYQHLHELR